MEVEKSVQDGLSKFELLELVLRCSGQRRNLKNTAKALLDRFDGFNGVFDATDQELMTVEGVSEKTIGLYLKEEV